MLLATQQLAADQLNGWAVAGELALDGGVRPVRGALSMAMAAKERGFTKLLLPAANAREAAVVEELAVYGVACLSEAVGVLSGAAGFDPVSPPRADFDRLNTYRDDFADVRGQEFAKRALVIAAAGGHNVLVMDLVGPQLRMTIRHPRRIRGSYAIRPTSPPRVLVPPLLSA